MACMIIGDSIAQGVAVHRPECLAIAERGIGSEQWARRHFPLPAKPSDLVIISMGSNDTDADDRAQLETIRDAITAPRVIWLVPSIPGRSRANVQAIAHERGDGTIDVRATPMANTIHPTDTSYGVIAREAR